MKKILIADDAEINRGILGSIFNEQFEVVEAENGAVAIDMIDKYADSLSLIFLDLIMPEKNGIEVLAYMKEADYLRYIPVIMITGEATMETDMKAHEYGVADIIYKPFSRRIVTRRALNIIELYEQRNDMEALLEQRTLQLRASQAKLERTNEFLMNALSSVLEFRSLESGEHIARVKNLTKIMLNNWVKLYPECGYSQDDIDQMVNASALHDIGKIGIPDEVLLKPGRLTKEEFDVIKTHTTIGCEILEKFKQENSDFYQYCYDICRYHHERYNGKGYPDGLVGNEIPVWAQIVSVVDVYDALVSPRVYKDPFEVPEAMRMIYDGECGIFGPEVLACFKEAEFEILSATEVSA